MVASDRSSDDVSLGRLSIAFGSPSGRRDGARQDKKPVGLLVWAGKHAIVMTGATMVDGRVTTIVTSDPYRSGPTVGRHRVWSAASFPLWRYRERDATPEYTKAWFDKYVVVLPMD